MDANEAIDYQVESQRGIFVCGVPFFTCSWLLPCDPPPFTDLRGNSTGTDLRQLQVPNPEWEWEWPSWVIDMSGPVDYHGWSYNLWYSKNGWHDGNSFGRCFVRQRRWMRQRTKIKIIEETSSEMVDAQDILQECRNDRERTDCLVEYITDQTVEGLVGSKANILAMYQFPSSIDNLYGKLSKTPAGQRFVDAKVS